MRFSLLSMGGSRQPISFPLAVFVCHGKVRRDAKKRVPARDGRVEHVFYPVFPPDTHAEAVLDWAGRNPL